MVIRQSRYPVTPGKCPKLSVLRQAGVGLIEVLVSLLVFSVGALGVSASQISAKRTNYEASQRSMAVALARDIFERMHRNSGSLSAYAVRELGSNPANAPVNCSQFQCSSSQLAAHDLFEWGQLLAGAQELAPMGNNLIPAGGLVDSRACISIRAGRVTVSISWRGVVDLDNPSASQCGEQSGLYGAAQEKRRLLHATTYIENIL